jgi:hypothetical protein
MTANNPHAQTEKPIPATVIFSHRLINKKADMANLLDLVNTVDQMTIRATSMLDVTSAHLLDSRESAISNDTIYWVLQSVIKEIEDLNVVVNAYVDSQA